MHDHTHRILPRITPFPRVHQFCGMTSIAENLKVVKANLPEHVMMVAVSKTHPAHVVQEAYEAGQHDFGENRVQELIEKQALLPKDIRWHLIGHLQRNKVKQIAAFVHLIHSIDSERLLREVDRQASVNSRVIDVLLQFHVAQEETKFGFSSEEAETMLAQADIKALQHVRIVGVMGMATFTEDETQVRSEFRKLKSIFSRLKETVLSGASHFSTISMGMSGDYPLAVEEGSTMVRVGSAIFGRR